MSLLASACLQQALSEAKSKGRAGKAIAYFVFAVSLASATARAQSVQEYVVRELAGCLNVRSEPQTTASSIACVATGTRVLVLDAVPYWRKVQLVTGEEGWAAKAYLEPIAGPPPGTPLGPLPQDAWLEVHFVDVGQGDAIWIHTPDDGVDGNGRFEGRNIVIDGGPISSDDRNALLAYLEARGHHGAVVDALFISHPHTDHFKGAETISRHFHVRDYYDPGFPSDLVTYRAFLQAMQGAPGVPPRAERIHLGFETFGTLDWGAELSAEVLYGWSSDLTGLGSGNTEVNNSSIVLRIEYGSHSFILMGDAEGKDRGNSPSPSRYVERILLNQIPQEKLRATVLKVGHHGSETSSTTDFIEAVSPEIVIVQSGRKSFGGTYLPDDSTLRRYCCHDLETRIYRTDQNDAIDGLSESKAADGDHIVVRTNGSVLEVHALEDGEPFVAGTCMPACL